MRTVLRPRLASIHVFTSALLVALGVKLQAGCASDLDTPDTSGSGGEGGSSAGPGPSGSGTTGPGSSTATGTATSTGVGTGGAGGAEGVGGAGGAGGAGGSEGVGGAGGNAGAGCVNPVPVLVNGMDTGFDTCAGGEIRRRAELVCPTNFPDMNPCCGSCPAGTVCSDQGEIACSCVPACTSDAECAPNQVCMCGKTAGVCISAKCATGADCAPGQECTSWDTSMGCLQLEFACTTTTDTCGGDLDCKQVPNNYCAVQPDGHRACMFGGCAIGRPFLVEDEARTAPIVRRADWSQERLVPSLEGLDPALRDELAASWEHTARMEHASIAAFARFSLQLLGLGAPPDLIERTNRAMADETKHARAAFALASAYRGRRLGPGSLPVNGALDGGSDPASVLRLVVREGCIGETVAAVEAGEAEENAVDPVVRAVLGEIANDESEHAELAWRTVRWALEAFGDEVRGAILEEIALVESELGSAPGVTPSSRDEERLLHGVVTDRMRATMRRTVLRHTVLPCLKALVAEALPRVA